MADAESHLVAESRVAFGQTFGEHCCSYTTSLLFGLQHSFAVQSQVITLFTVQLESFTEVLPCHCLDIIQCSFLLHICYRSSSFWGWLATWGCSILSPGQKNMFTDAPQTRALLAHPDRPGVFFRVFLWTLNNEQWGWTYTVFRNLEGLVIFEYKSVLTLVLEFC